MATSDKGLLLTIESVISKNKRSSFGLNFFSEIAKFRAARRLWARIMKERYGATVPKAQMLRVHVHTAGSVLTAQQPLNNVARITWQAMSAVLAGIQSMTCCAYDEAIALPTEESATLGEICDVLRSVFGEYQQSTNLF